MITWAGQAEAQRLSPSPLRPPPREGLPRLAALLDQKNLQAVVISTPDHTHAPAAMAAMRRGLHVYVQKPLTHSVFEARQLRLMAQKSGVVTQRGNQHRSGAHQKGAKALLQQGAIGKVRSAHCWTDRPIWPQGIDRPAGRDKASKLRPERSGVRGSG